VESSKLSECRGEFWSLEGKARQGKARQGRARKPLACTNGWMETGMIE